MNEADARKDSDPFSFSRVLMSMNSHLQEILKTGSVHIDFGPCKE